MRKPALFSFIRNVLTRNLLMIAFFLILLYQSKIINNNSNLENIPQTLKMIESKLSKLEAQNQNIADNQRKFENTNDALIIVNRKLTTLASQDEIITEQQRKTEDRTTKILSKIVDRLRKIEQKS